MKVLKEYKDQKGWELHYHQAAFLFDPEVNWFIKILGKASISEANAIKLAKEAIRNKDKWKTSAKGTKSYKSKFYPAHTAFISNSQKFPTRGKKKSNEQEPISDL